MFRKSTDPHMEPSSEEPQAAPSQCHPGSFEIDYKNEVQQ